ncbi:MAG: hypothetical protein ACI9HK_002055 [Pirellulaceae bacterium]|jgi:hypothetical protein
MAIYLDEEQVGSDANSVAYPHLVLCMGVTCLMGDGTLVGVHITAPLTEAASMANFLTEIQANASAMNTLYLIGNTTIHCTRDRQMTVHENARSKAAAIEYAGKIHTYDTGHIKPQDGTFAQITTNGADQKCTIVYKRNEKMAYAKGEAPRNERGYQCGVAPTIGHSLVVGATTMHTASHFWHMTDTTVT